MIYRNRSLPLEKPSFLVRKNAGSPEKNSVSRLNAYHSSTPRISIGPNMTGW
jgi:hypothetical protein